MENKDVEAQTQSGKTWKDGDLMDWDKICFVRSVRSWDQIQVKNVDGEKRIVMPSIINSTKGEAPRLTLHWALNHKVSAHMWGTWDNAPITIIASGENTIKENGKPLSLYAVDTYWSKDVIVPDNSIIIYSGEIPPEFSDLKGIFIKSPVGIDEIQKSHEVNDASLKELEKHNVNKYEELESEYFRMTSEMGEKVNTVVNKKIEEMGYTVFEGDNGTYMHMRGLDNAIYELAMRENLGTYIHAESAMYALENPSLTLAMTNPEKLFDVKSDKSEFHSAIKDMRNALKDIKKNDSKYDKNSVMVFCGELFNIIKKYPDKILDDKRGLNETILLFDDYTHIRNTITEWMGKEDNTSREFKNLREIFDILNLDDHVKAIESWSEEGKELVIIKTITNIDIKQVSALLKNYFYGKYDTFLDVKINNIGNNKYEFRFTNS